MIKSTFHHGHLKEESLRIAFDFIKKEDIEKLTLKIISDATGTSRSAIYKHFSSKENLIETLIIDGLEKFDLHTSPTLRDSSIALVDRFYLAGKLYITFARENPNLYRLLFGHKYAHIRESVINIKDENCSGFGALKLAVEEGQSSGILKEESSFMRTIIIWSSLHGLSTLAIDGFMHVDQDVDEIYEELFSGLLNNALSSKVKVISKIPILRKLTQHS